MTDQCKHKQIRSWFFVDTKETAPMWSCADCGRRFEPIEQDAVQDLAAECDRLRDALELIAAPMRLDGTWNRDREACRQMAVEALGRTDDGLGVRRLGGESR